VPWFRAFEVLGPGEPPVPLTVLPLESVLPLAPPAPLEEAALPPLPPELVPDGACAKVLVPNSKSRSVTANSLIPWVDPMLQHKSLPLANENEFASKFFLRRSGRLLTLNQLDHGTFSSRRLRGTDVVLPLQSGT
jgi:hypothetical protein